MNRLTKAPAALIAAAAFGIVLAGCASDASETAETAAATQSAPASSAAESQPSAGESASPAIGQTESAAPGAGEMPEAEAQATDGAWIDQATYEANPQKYHDAGNVVLFFNASWCPTCQQTVTNLDSEGVPPGLTVVSVDFDQASELRQDYGVTVQHTFVQVDASGAEQAKFTGALTGEQISSQTV